MNVSRFLFALVASACLSAVPLLGSAAPDAAVPQADNKAAAPAASSEASGAASAVAEIPPETPIATVNGKPITKAEFDTALEGYVRQIQRMGGKAPGDMAQFYDQIKADVIQQLVDRELLYQESIKEPVADMEGPVQQQLDEYRGRFPTQEEFDKALFAQGLDLETLRDLLGRQIQVRHYVETKVAPGIEVTDDSIRGFYDENLDKFAVPEQVKASHILIRVEAGADEAARTAAKAKAEGLRKRSLAGEDFAALAKEFSEDPGSAPGGGDLGFFQKERMVPPFAEAAFALERGKISEVVETRFGYHVIKVTDRQAAGRREFEQVKGSIGDYLRSRALDVAVKERVTALREGAKIDLLVPPQ